MEINAFLMQVRKKLAANLESEITHRQSPYNHRNVCYKFRPVIFELKYRYNKRHKNLLMKTRQVGNLCQDQQFYTFTKKFVNILIVSITICQFWFLETKFTRHNYHNQEVFKCVGWNIEVGTHFFPWKKVQKPVFHLKFT